MEDKEKLDRTDEDASPSAAPCYAMFTLEIVDHWSGRIAKEVIKGTPYYLSTLLQYTLENLPENCGVIINKA